MPLYAYRCQAPECQAEQEEFRRISDRLRDAVCETCGALAPFTLSHFSALSWPPAGAKRQHCTSDGGFILEHMPGDKQVFHSRDELRRHCRANGLTVEALL
jgi:putative FmdB family regulatory protein